MLILKLVIGDLAFTNSSLAMVITVFHNFFLTLTVNTRSIITISYATNVRNEL